MTVTLIATDIDGPSDVAATSYRLDGGSVVSYTAPFTVAGNGTHTISFASVDRALNAETPPPSQTFKIDTTPPVIVPQITGSPGSNGWYGAPFLSHGSSRTLTPASRLQQVAALPLSVPTLLASA